MPMDRGTPDLVRHCVAAVAKQYGGDTSKAFAICVAQLQRNGYLKPGTMELTAAGKKKEKEHESEPDAEKKMKSYEKLLKAARKGNEQAEASATPAGYLPKTSTAKIKKISYERAGIALHFAGKIFDEFLKDNIASVVQPDDKAIETFLKAGLDEKEIEILFAKARAAKGAAVELDKPITIKTQVLVRESATADFDALMSPEDETGLEHLPRAVSRRFETVSHRESSMDTMRRLAGLTVRHEDRTLPAVATPSKAGSLLDLAEAAPPDLLLKIAKKHFDVETLATRNRDSLDFKDVAVWSIEAALREAYEAGFKAGSESGFKTGADRGASAATKGLLSKAKMVK